MPLTPVQFPYDVATGAAVVPASATSEWTEAIEAEGLTEQDQPTGHKYLRSAAAIASHTGRILLKRDSGQGTTLRVRLKYRTSDGTVASPLVIRVFAGMDEDPSSDTYIALRNALNEASVPVRTDVGSDSIVGDYSYTIPDNNEHSWDCDGYVYFIIGVEETYNGTNASDAVLEVRII